MKINKFQFYTAIFGLVSGVSLVGNFHLLKKEEESSREIFQLEQELACTQNELEDLKEIEEINSINDLNRYFKGRITINVLWTSWCNSTQLYISRPEGAFGNIEIPEVLYQKINYIISKYEIKSVRFYNLGDEFDISKLDILAPMKPDIDLRNSGADIIELVVTDCKENFNYEALLNIKPKYIEISLDELNNPIKEWLENSHLENCEIKINSDNSYEYLKFLADTKKEIGKLNIVANADEESLSILPEIHAKKVMVDSRTYYQEKLDFDLVLNKDTESLELGFGNFDGIIKNKNKLGKIKVTSPNPNLNVAISSNMGLLEHFHSITYVTENTSFDLPEKSTISFYNIRYSDENQILHGTIEYEKDMDLVSMLEPLLEAKVEKTIGTN